MNSSVEAEYRGVANVVFETCWIRNLLLELHCSIPSATLVYRDNVRAFYLAGNPVHHQRTKHIEIDIHFVREKLRRGMFVCFMFPLGLKSPTFLRRAFLKSYLMIFAPVSASANLPIRLRGCARIEYLVE